MAEHGYRLVLSMASDDPRQKHFIEGAGKRLAMMGRPAEPLLPPPAKKVRATRRYAGGFKLGGYTKSETIEKL